MFRVLQGVPLGDLDVCYKGLGEQSQRTCVCVFKGLRGCCRALEL